MAVAGDFDYDQARLFVQAREYPFNNIGGWGIISIGCMTAPYSDAGAYAVRPIIAAADDSTVAAGVDELTGKVYAGRHGAVPACREQNGYCSAPCGMESGCDVPVHKSRKASNPAEDFYIHRHGLRS